jgi:hypothetical protein
VITATVERFKDHKNVFKVTVTGPCGRIIQHFDTNEPKSNILDWATSFGAEEVTFKL